MTTLYKPVLIETVEQAEALPVGTVATDLGTSIVSAAVRTDVGLGWFVSGDEMTDMHEHLVGWTALVPIEAEEETRDHPGIMLPTDPPRHPQQTRLVTTWEPA